MEGLIGPVNDPGWRPGNFWGVTCLTGFGCVRGQGTGPSAGSLWCRTVVASQRALHDKAVVERDKDAGMGLAFGSKLAAVTFMVC